ncbi:hypothetical protein NN3_43860 [Nocardia neocaledoniensis NBRC 108232]|nr:hypothetical protein NN3_43860 [Nocardia neocaledoniensis NBRC 108232]
MSTLRQAKPVRASTRTAAIATITFAGPKAPTGVATVGGRVDSRIVHPLDELRAQLRISPGKPRHLAHPGSSAETGHHRLTNSYHTRAEPQVSRRARLAA